MIGFSRPSLRSVAMVATLAFGTATAAEGLPEYTPVSGVSGSISSVGSDTLNNLMTFWAEAFNAQYPNVNIQVEGKGSSTAPPALTEGASQLGPMSREMKREEIDAFEKKNGYKPTQIPVAIDALAVFVHKDNPVKGLTLTQVDQIFSSSFKRGGKDATTWGDIGLDGEWTKRSISIYGRNSSSGTYGFFKESALKKGDFKATVKEQPGSSGVVQGVANDLGAIGYSGIGYLTAGVKALPLADGTGAPVEPNYQNCLSGEYPLARYLYVYVNKKPGQALDPAVKQFLTLVLSKQGQEIVEKDGYFPLPADIAAESIALLK